MKIEIDSSAKIIGEALGVRISEFSSNNFDERAKLLKLPTTVEIINKGLEDFVDRVENLPLIKRRELAEKPGFEKAILGFDSTMGIQVWKHEGLEESIGLFNGRKSQFLIVGQDGDEVYTFVNLSSLERVVSLYPDIFPQKTATEIVEWLFSGDSEVVKNGHMYLGLLSGLPYFSVEKYATLFQKAFNDPIYVDSRSLFFAQEIDIEEYVERISKSSLTSIEQDLQAKVDKQFLLHISSQGEGVSGFAYSDEDLEYMHECKSWVLEISQKTGLSELIERMSLPLTQS